MRDRFSFFQESVRPSVGKGPLSLADRFFSSRWDLGIQHSMGMRGHFLDIRVLGRFGLSLTVRAYIDSVLVRSNSRIST